MSKGDLSVNKATTRLTERSHINTKCYQIRLRRRAVKLRETLYKRFKSTPPPIPVHRGIYCECKSERTRAAIWCALWSMKAQMTQRQYFRFSSKFVWWERWQDKTVIKLRLRYEKEKTYALLWAAHGDVR
jgi:hypothetical protein